MRSGNSKWCWSDAAGQLNSMLDGSMVLTEHIVYKTLSTSLTLFSASFSPKGEPDAVAGEVSDGREDEFYLRVGVWREYGQRSVRVIRDLAHTCLPVHRALLGPRTSGSGRAVASSAASLESHR